MQTLLISASLMSSCPWFVTATTRHASSWLQIMDTQMGFPRLFFNVVIDSISEFTDWARN